MSMRAIDAARAANTLLEFSGDDQQALLEVMTYYFTSPDEGRDSGSDLQNEHVPVLWTCSAMFSNDIIRNTRNKCLNAVFLKTECS